jgi:hypothetical protein
VSPVQRGRLPRGALYRIGHRPDPLAWPPKDSIGIGRFDDPLKEFRVLYATTRRRTAFIETLAHFRLTIGALADLRTRGGQPSPPPVALILPEWYEERVVGQLRLVAGQRWLDLRWPQTHQELRRELAPTLLVLGINELDFAAVLGPERPLTQAIARWAYERGYAGIVYASRLDARLACWAIFEGASFEQVGDPVPITPDDPDLRAVARLYGLRI